MIPWTTMLRHLPTMLAAADALFIRAKTSGADAHTKSIEDRLGALEKNVHESAQLAQEMAQQIQALAVAQEASVRRVRVAVGLSVAAVVVAIVVGILAIVR
jgi:hypothetical protein